MASAEILWNKLKTGRLTFWVLVMIVAILPLYYWYLPPFIILLALLWYIENHSRFSMYFGSRSGYRVLMFLFIALFLWQTAGLIYSENIKLGLSNVFGRLSLIAFPLIIFNPDKKIKDNINIILKVFALFTLLYVLICFGYALYRSLSFSGGSLVFNPHPQEYEWNNYFSSSYFTFSIHPSYLAMFVVLSVFISLEMGRNSNGPLLKRSFWFFTGLFLFISLFFIASRAGILAGLVLLFLYSVNNVFRKGKMRIVWIGILSVMILFFPVFRKNDRVKYILENVSNYLKGTSADGQKDDRIIAWESSLKLIRSNIVFGVGVGDVRDELVKEYDKVNAEMLSNQRLNVHNQFLEVILENGVIGFSIFLSIFGMMTYIAIREKNLLYGLFIVMTIVFFMFETVLYRLAGVVFFSLFAFLLLHYRQNVKHIYPGNATPEN